MRRFRLLYLALFYAAALVSGETAAAPPASPGDAQTPDLSRQTAARQEPAAVEQPYVVRQTQTPAQESQARPASGTDGANQTSAQPMAVESEDRVVLRLPAGPPRAPDTGNQSNFNPLKFTLGPDDVVEITIMRHPEFSGVYPINLEGKLQYKFVGDIDVNGLTKADLEKKIREIISTYVLEPEVNVTVIEYRSKVFYVLGEVSTPGKYYMRAETIPVREALFEAGLPTSSAAMRKCRIITPRAKGRPRVRKVDVYAILYSGNLRNNLAMQPGDVLYVPSTLMAKLISIISPPASVVGVASSGPSSASGAKTATETLRGRPL